MFGALKLVVVGCAYKVAKTLAFRRFVGSGEGCCLLAGGVGC